MYKFPIGVMLDSFRLPFDEALEKVVEVGADGFQFYVSAGEFAPDNMTKEKCREIVKKVRDKGLVISALCGETGHGLWQKERNPEVLELSRKIFAMCGDLDTSIMTAHIGAIPADRSSEKYDILYKAMTEMGNIASYYGATFAIETGPEKSDILEGFLKDLDNKGVRVNLDPANLTMVSGDDAVAAAHRLAKYTVHSHAKDGNMLQKVDPECVYGGKPMPANIQGPTFEEVPLGTGSVDFPNYLQALSEEGYKGFLTIEREVGDDPYKDIKMAVDFLKGLTR